MAADCKSEVFTDTGGSTPSRRTRFEVAVKGYARLGELANPPASEAGDRKEVPVRLRGRVPEAVAAHQRTAVRDATASGLLRQFFNNSGIWFEQPAAV